MSKTCSILSGVLQTICSHADCELPLSNVAGSVTELLVVLACPMDG